MKLLSVKISIAIFFLVSAMSLIAQSEPENGIDLYRKGEFDEAVTLLSDAVKTNTKDRDAWLYLGASLVKLRNEKDALKAFRKAKSSLHGCGSLKWSSGNRHIGGGILV